MSGDTDPQTPVTVPFLDLPAQLRGLRAEVDAAVARVLDSAHFVLGAEVAAFEEEFAAYCGARYCVGVDSGLSALELALRAAGIGPGDEVITAAHTFIATVVAITRVGAVPVLVEVDPRTYLLDPAAVAAALTPRTRALVPVHLYGQTADMEPLLHLAQRHHLFVLEDAAQAHGARYRGRRAGSLAHAAAFSFYPGKNLGAAGDGGAVTTDDAALAERIRMLGNYGQRVRYHHDLVGGNHRLDSLQAAILRVKLRRLDEWNAARRQVAATYTARLAGLPLALPAVAPANEPVWHLYVIRVAARDEVQRRLAARGISTQTHYPVPIHRQAAYPHFAGLHLPVSEWIAAQCLSLPMFAQLTGAQLAAVTREIAAVLRDMPAPGGPPGATER